jgi:hypothetical protein
MATTNMNITLPVEGASTGTWDTILNAALEGPIDEHDHTSGKGVQVPSAGIGVDADLSFAGYGITAMEALRFEGAETDVTSKTKGLAVKTDNELYWVTSGGTEVKITSGSGLNVSLVGGISGDYSSTDANLTYVDASKTYKLLQDESPDHWAKIGVGDIALYEAASGITKAVTLKSPGTLATAYNITMPAALPAAGARYPLSIDENGVSYLDGSHGEIRLVQDILGGYQAVASAARDANGHVVGSGGGTPGWQFGISGLKVGDRIKSVEVFHNRGSGPTDINVELYEKVADALPTPGITGEDSVSSASTPTAFSASTSGPVTVAADTGYFVRWTADLGSGSPKLYSCHVIVDRP